MFIQVPQDKSMQNKGLLPKKKKKSYISNNR